MEFPIYSLSNNLLGINCLAGLCQERSKGQLTLLSRKESMPDVMAGFRLVFPVYSRATFGKCYAGLFQELVAKELSL